MDQLLTLLRLAVDLHLGAAASGPDQIARMKSWIETDEGNKVIGDIDQLLSELGLPIAIAIRKAD